MLRGRSGLEVNRELRPMNNSGDRRLTIVSQIATITIEMRNHLVKSFSLQIPPIFLTNTTQEQHTLPFLYFVEQITSPGPICHQHKPESMTLSFTEKENFACTVQRLLSFQLLKCSALFFSLNLFAS